MPLRIPNCIATASKTPSVVAWRADQAAARGNRGEGRADQAVDVEQRHDIEATVAGCEVKGRANILRRGANVRLSQRDALGPGGRARRVQHKRNVVPADLAANRRERA